MDIEEILSQLQRNEGYFAKDAVLEAVAHKDEITPHLLEVLRDVVKHPEAYTDPPIMIHIYATFLLAQFRAAEAYPLLIAIFSLPGEMPFDVLGEGMTGQIGDILASVSHGEVADITALIENELLDTYVRAGAIEALATLYVCGERSREEVVAYFHRLFQTWNRTPNLVWSFLACSAVDMWPDEAMMVELKRAWDDGLIDPRIVGWDDIERDHRSGLEDCMALLREMRGFITDVRKGMGWWACFKKDREAERVAKAAILSAARPKLGALYDDIEEPYRRSSPKVGRNEPCPCGSGKKFKKCCGR